MIKPWIAFGLDMFLLGYAGTDMVSMCCFFNLQALAIRSSMRGYMVVEIGV